MISKPGKPTQAFVPIKEVRDGFAILNDGTMRALIMVSSVNFALKSKDEQQAILFQFQNFLNSLDFSVQIFIQSRRLDIKPYIALLENRLKDQPSDLLKIQTQEYINFIKDFTEKTSIMTKSFFVVVPYSPQALQKGGSFGFGKKSKNTEQFKKDEEQFEENRAQLEERIAVVDQGLSRSSLRVVKLGTEELVELFYKEFNPGDTEKPIQLTT